MATTDSYGHNGFFIFRIGGQEIQVISSDGHRDVDSELAGWEHVSATMRNEKRCPTWDEMCKIKDLFWDEAENVIQYHPPANEYVNNHPFVLHLWKPPFVVPRPPQLLIGIQSVGVLRPEDFIRRKSRRIRK